MASSGYFPYVSYIRCWQIAKNADASKAKINIAIPEITNLYSMKSTNFQQKKVIRKYLTWKPRPPHLSQSARYYQLLYTSSSFPKYLVNSTIPRKV